MVNVAKLRSLDIWFQNDVIIGEILKTDDCAEIGYSVEVDLHYPNEIEETTISPFFLINKKANTNDFTEYMTFIKLKNCRLYTSLDEFKTLAEDGPTYCNKKRRQLVNSKLRLLIQNT